MKTAGTNTENSRNECRKRAGWSEKSTSGL